MPQENSDVELKLLIEAIYLKYSYDFRNYSRASQKRRIEHAMQAMNCETISTLQSKILYSASEFMQLLQYLTIPVSEMFRDPHYFLAIRDQVVPFLKTYPSLKIWIAGCSTGEEVYSMAILFREEGLLERTIIYATDINPISLEKAKKGLFAADRMDLYADNYQKSGGKASLSDYYTSAYDSVIFDRSLSEHITFADHSLATDSVFSETHMISCRNVIIYFNKELQERTLGLFYESLCHRGFLGLGNKESIDFSEYSKKFEPLSKRDRVFRKV